MGAGFGVPGEQSKRRMAYLRAREWSVDQDVTNTREILPRALIAWHDPRSFVGALHSPWAEDKKTIHLMREWQLLKLGSILRERVCRYVN
jgi:hypothetical protein